MTSNQMPCRSMTVHWAGLSTPLDNDAPMIVRDCFNPAALNNILGSEVQGELYIYIYVYVGQRFRRSLQDEGSLLLVKA